MITEFRFDALPGENVVAAWSDENNNSVVDAGDYFGMHPYTIAVTAGGEVRGVAVPLAKVIDALHASDLETARLMELLPPAFD